MVVNIPELPGKKKYSGLYCISALPPKDENKKDFVIKIGMSINLRKRLQSYHTCFPYGFYIYGLLICNKKSRKDILKLEKLFFEKLIRLNPDYYLKTKEISGSKEYFKLPLSVLKKSLQDFATESKDKAVTEFKDEGFYENDDEELKPVVTDKEYERLVNEVDRKVEHRNETEEVKMKHLETSTKRYDLRRHVRGLQDQLNALGNLVKVDKLDNKQAAKNIKELEQAQIAYNINGLRKRAVK